MPKGREHEFATEFIKLWKLKLNGWAFRIPDAYHIDKATQKRYSHKRPADWLVTCPAYSALIEFKFLPKALSFMPMVHLRPSQIETILDLNMDTLRYYLVVGNGDGAWAWQCSMFLLRHWEENDVRLDMIEEPCVGWYPFSGLSLMRGDDEAMLK